MMAPSLLPPVQLTVLALALTVNAAAYAQSATVKEAPIVVTGRAEPAFDSDSAQLGLGVTMNDSPQSISVFTQGLLKEADAKSLSRTLALDASLSDAYNAVGYFESVQIRGFVLDSVNNYQRNGLPTLNYAPFAAENKSQIEVLKGVSGLQAAVSAPGGLLNYRVKQPGVESVTELNLGVAQGGGKLVHLDVSRADVASGLALRVNALHEAIRPAAFHTEGSRSLLSAYATWAASAQTKVDVDLEWQRKSQFEQPGFGLLDMNSTGVATTLPRLAFNAPNAIDPRTNMNAQPWSLPFQQQFWTVALHVKHELSDVTTLNLDLQSQRLVTNDRIAFPDGNFAAGVYPGAAANGDMNLYDYRSENERRMLHVVQLGLTHRSTIAGMRHVIQAQLQSYRQRFDPQAMQVYNYVGTTNQFIPLVTSPNPSLSGNNTSNAERVTSLMLSDAIALTAQSMLYLGLRSSHLARSSDLSDGSESTSYTQQINTPSGGITWVLSPSLTGYISAGQGIESEVVPNRSADFANPGQALPALKSRQAELGMKWQPSSRLLATAAVFDISKPYSDKDLSNNLLIAGAKRARHTGLELSASGAVTSQLSLSSSALWLNARYTQAMDAKIIGQHVTNVAPFTASIFADYKLDTIKGLSLNTRLRYDSEKPVFADASIANTKLPAATQWDIGLRYRQALASSAVSVITWRLAVENVLNRVYWKEAPTTSWQGIYLFPNTPRRLNFTAQFDL
jgi:iron complex outermembrane receptor protein